MKQPVFLSVIIPTYNSSAFVDQTLESVVESLDSLEHMEIIVIDDGSKDDTPTILSSWSSRLANFSVFYCDHGGVASARNTGLSHAKGEWILFLDADDILDKKTAKEIPKALEYATIHNLNWTAFTYKKFWGSRPDSNQIQVDTAPTVRSLFSFSPLNFPICVGSIIVKSMIAKNSRGFALNEPIGEDLDLWVRIGLENNLLFCNQPLLHYRQRKGTEVLPRERNYSSIFPAIRNLLSLNTLTKSQLLFVTKYAVHNIYTLKRSQAKNRHRSQILLVKEFWRHSALSAFLLLIVSSVPLRAFDTIRLARKHLLKLRVASWNISAWM